MKIWSRLGARRQAIAPDRAALLKEFNDPLSYMDAASLRRLRKQCIRIALLYTFAGAGLMAVLIWADNSGLRGSGLPGRGGGGRMGSGIAIFTLFIYGVFRLCTIKRSMIRRRRDTIALQNIADHAKRESQK